MAINKEIGKRKSFGDIYLRTRVSEDEPLLKVEKAAESAGLWRAVERELFPPLVLFKCLILEIMYGLSDREAERVLRRDMLFMRFVGLGMDDPVPDHSTLSRFRERLKGTGLVEGAMRYLERTFEEKGLVVKKGVIVDASIVPAQRRDDPEARWVKRGKKSRFGFKANLAVDKDTMMVRRVEASPADVHDSLFFEAVLPLDVDEVLADKAYDDDGRRRRLRGMGIRPNIMKRARRNNPLSQAEKALNKEWGRRRARVETVFGCLKNMFGLSRARWKGLARCRLQTLLACLAWNLFHAAKLAYTQ